jgi:hypothetical protein
VSKLITRERKSKKELETLFDKQWLKLKRRGCPKQTLEILKNQKRDFISIASEISFAKGNLHLLLIVPRTHLTAYTQMPMLKNGNQRGYVSSLFCPTAVFETFEIENFKEPYYLLDIEDGDATLGQSPEEAENFIKKKKRFCLTEIESIHLSLQDSVLKRHYLDATGCRYGDDSKVPFLALDDTRRPILSWCRYKRGHPRWGSPSCGKRLAL